LILLLALEIGGGCAWFRKEEPDPPPFQRIALRTQVDVEDDGELEGDLHGDTAVKGTAIGLGTGSVTGGGLGFWWGAATCGPATFLYGLCVAIVTAFGVVVGGTTGAVAGGTTGLPWKAAGKVNENLTEIQHKRSFPKEFRGAVKAAVPAAKQVREDRAEAVVTALLDDVDLRQHLRQRMSLRMHASMTQEWDRGKEDPPTRTCRYEYTSPTYDVEDWLLQDGKAFDDTFTEGISAFAHWMARDLQAFSTRTAQPETAEEPATCFQVRED
jgi:hypothetical protein